MPESRDLKIRRATTSDTELILDFIRELAEYEKAKHEVSATHADIQDSLFGADALAHAFIGEAEGTPVCMAVCFYSYSTWLGKKGLYLEDLYVSPSSRGRGHGKAMLAHLAKHALAQGCERFEWRVLDWNQPAIALYEGLGATRQTQWLGYRLSGDALKAVAEKT